MNTDHPNLAGVSAEGLPDKEPDGRVGAAGPTASDAEMIQTWIADAAAFWRNVQEPSTRVGDRALLARLARLSLERFTHPHIRAAATVNLLYRSIEPGWDDGTSSDELAALHAECCAELKPLEESADCRWMLSLGLAKAARELAHGDLDAATAALVPAGHLAEFAHAKGQVFTNVVKSLLARVVVSSIDGSPPRTIAALIEQADAVLAKARTLAANYLFNNEWAFEEVAYVYTMLRQVYNWRRLVARGTAPLAALQATGFRWQCIGGPFNSLLQNAAAVRGAH